MSSNDLRGPLASWNDSIHFCQWPGLTCGDLLHPQRVTSLELRSSNLAGSISPAIANLTFLRKMDLSNNQIYGPIPQEIGRLFQLQHLNLSVNSLGEGIPPSLSNCSKLQVICLNKNMFQGEIPPSLTICSDLRIISLRDNNLRGNIPPLLTNLSFLSVLSMANNQLNGGIPAMGELYSLTVLDLSENQLSGGIPPSLGNLLKLTQLDLSNNHLSGDITTSLWNLSSLSHLSMAYNNLSGFLPSNVGNSLPLLERIYLYNNRFQGPIPISLSNASHLEIIDLSSNRLMGSIPINLGGLQNLQWLNLCNNQLEVREPDGWSFLTALSNCTNLEKLQLDSNNLGGLLPNSIANFSTKLQRLTMSDNEISGSISPGIGNLASLTTLEMGRNLLNGSIPASLGMLKNMHVLHLGNNRLSGEVPSTLGNLTQLNSLHLECNGLSGIIPPNLGSCQNLIILDLSFNKLSGGIPKEILTISTLSIYLDLAHNSLTGLIPSEVGCLRNLGKIDFSMNKLSGELPISLGSCQELGKLYLRGNFFHGNISCLSTVRGMQELDLSENNLSGQIPYRLQDFRFLYYVNLSFNNFEGEVPRWGVFANRSAVSVLGNTKLCGGNPILHLAPCTFQSSGKNYRFATLAGAILSATLCLCFFLILYWIWKPRREFNFTEPVFAQKRITYAQLLSATNGFSTDNLIAVGGFGAVYRGTIEYDQIAMFSGNYIRVKLRIAVKVLNLHQRGAFKSFTTERDVLRNTVHPNIIRMLTTCSSVDFMGNDFKAMVFEFMANGSLDNWLHPIAYEQSNLEKFNITRRISIAIDVASALNYLHHSGEEPIIHCDIKPSNILLDDNMAAHLSDFGLARPQVETLIRSSMHTCSTYGFRGTIGYVASGENFFTVFISMLYFYLLLFVHLY